MFFVVRSIQFTSGYSAVCGTLRLGLKPIAVAGTLAAAFAAGACSADISRFDSSNFNLNEPASAPLSGSAMRRNAGAPVLDAPPAAPKPTAGLNQAAPLPRQSSGVAVAALQPIDEPQPTQQSINPPPPRPTASRPIVTPPAPKVAPKAVAKGEPIEVQQGDTLYGLGKRYNVMISDLMAVNELRNPSIKPGQKLYLPAGVSAGRVAVPRARPQASAPDAAAMMPAATDWTGSYTVKPGDSLYVIASRHKVKASELQRVNKITDVMKVKPGIVLKVPGSGSPSAAVAVASPIEPPVRTQIASSTGIASEAVAPAPAPRPGLNVLNEDGPRQVGPVEQREAKAETSAPVQAKSAASGGAMKLRWPVKGKIVQGFGARADGSHNDGVDVAVPIGTDVMAAEAGVVAYAGSEVKTYGNLVLVRHDNGWITAYAYNDKILVQRGDRVKRGQPIAKAGKSGPADQPQLHFEVRVGSKPVDPMPFLDKM